MTLTALQKKWIPRIEDELKSSLETLDFGQSTELKTMLSYHMGWADGGSSGKRLRPLLTLLCAGALGGVPNNVLPGAVAIEFLHNFTLIHDDIEDQSAMRHGRLTLWQRWGIPLAINAGDALFSISQIAMLVLRETLDSETAVRASLKFNQVCLNLTRGQHMDIAFEKDEQVDQNAYLEMVRGKTAALIGFTSWLGGLAAQQGEETLSLLYDFGENLGLAFQMQDDMLGIWGDPKVTGKSSAGDIQNKKKTLPILFGLANCPEFQSQWREPQPDSQQVSTMAEILAACGAREDVQRQASHFTEQAFTTLNNLFRERNTDSNGLFELVENLLQRDF
jgi:geranylgeranyl diphosphate synthase type I